MKIGFIGLGKLGLPVALAIESKKHQIYGYDIDNNVIESIREKKIPYKEKGIQKLLNKTKINILPIKKILEKSELIFIAIQTPHEKKYEGITKIPNSRKDFNYTYIVNLIKKLSLEANKLKIKKNIVIISTVLPGTIRKKIIPIKSKYINICYNPFFIAMGNTINDFLKPEFILLGGNNKEANKKVIKFYKTINTSKVFSTTLENAELIKVSYNTFISTKISFINTIMEACHKLPNTNVDQVSSALKMASKRLISKAYLNGGMGDGGGCHPRDNIALSHLSEKLNLSFNWFDNIMMQREKQTEWLASLIVKNKKKMKVNILGKSFKDETNLITGSPSILLKNILLEKKINVQHWDPYVDFNFKEYEIKYSWKKNPQLYFIGTKHKIFKKFPFCKGSVVIDPWRIIEKNKNIKLISVGIGPDL